MTNLSRLKNKIIAKAITRFPSFSKRFTEAYKVYETHGEIPWAPLERELRDCKLALVSTCGVHHIDQEPFDMNDPNGDPSFRAIDLTKPLRDLIITHDYYDHSDADKDINIVFPVERLKEFETEGLIGILANTHFGFMGHITGACITTLINKSAPTVANWLKADDVDVVLLTPAWGICNQSVGLIQREIEKIGIATIGISIVRDFSEKVRPPRTIFLDWPFGHPLGEPFNIKQQRAVTDKALKALFSIQKPGEIIDIPFRWGKESYSDYKYFENLKGIGIS